MHLQASPHSDASGSIPVEGSLEAEVIVLRQQLNVLRRSAPKRPALKLLDRLIFVSLYLSPSEIPSAWPEAPNRAMKSIHAGPAQSDQVVAPRPGSIETIARGREFSSASSADSAASERAQRPTLRNFDRLVVVCLYRSAPRILDAL